MNQKSLDGIDKGEIRCPLCGKLILKIVMVTPETVLDLVCPNLKCELHKQGFIHIFTKEESPEGHKTNKKGTKLWPR